MNDHKPTGAHQPGRTESTVDYAALDKQPRQIGRYRIKNLLGKGGFGLVYLAHDEQLDRFVAIKVPHARLIAQPSDAEAYLTEARTVANLGSSPFCVVGGLVKAVSRHQRSGRRPSALGCVGTAEPAPPMIGHAATRRIFYERPAPARR
jgi:hypothetical protein